MRVVEFRIPLPLQVDQYHISQLFMVAHASLEDTKNSIEDGVECLEGAEFDDAILGKGHYTHKRIFVAGKIPSWMLAIVNREWLTMDEKSWNKFPHLKTVYECPVLPRLTFTIESTHHEGIYTHDNALNLSPDILSQRRVINIDILNDSLSPDDYKKEEDPSLWHSEKSGLGPLRHDWHETSAHLMTCYKVFTLDVPLGWFSGKVETFILNSMRNVLLIAHRRCICWMDRWYNMTLDDVRRLEDQVKRELDGVWKARRKLLGQEESESTTEDEKTEKEQDVLGSSIEFEVAPEDVVPCQTPRKYLHHGYNTNKIHHPHSPYVNLFEVLDSTSLLSSPNSNSARDQSIPISASPPPLKDGTQPTHARTTQESRSGVSSSIPQVKIDHKGFLYKLSDGFFSATWNLRFVILRGHQFEYYHDPKDTLARDIIDLRGASVAFQLEEVRERPHSLSITPAVGTKREILLSGETIEETKQWVLWLQLASLSSYPDQKYGSGTPSPPASHVKTQKDAVPPSLEYKQSVLRSTELEMELTTRPAENQDPDLACLIEEVITAGKVAHPSPDVTTMTPQMENYSYVGCQNTVRMYVRDVSQWASIHSEVNGKFQRSTHVGKKSRNSSSKKRGRSSKIMTVNFSSSSDSAPLLDSFCSFSVAIFKVFNTVISTFIKLAVQTHFPNILAIPFILELVQCFYVNPGYGFEFLIVPFSIVAVSILLVQLICQTSPILSFVAHIGLRWLLSSVAWLMLSSLLALVFLSALAVWLVDAGRFLRAPALPNPESIESETLKSIPHVGVGSITMMDVSCIDVFRVIMEGSKTPHWLSGVKEVQQIRRSSLESLHRDFISETFQLGSPTDVSVRSILSSMSSSKDCSIVPVNLFTSFIQTVLFSSETHSSFCRWRAIRHWGVFSNGSIFIVSYSSADAENEFARKDSETTIPPSKSHQKAKVSTLSETTSPNARKASNVKETTVSKPPNHGYPSDYEAPTSTRIKSSSNSEGSIRLADRLLECCEEITASNVVTAQTPKCMSRDMSNIHGVIGWLITPLGQTPQSCQVTQLIGFNAGNHFKGRASIVNEVLILRRLDSLSDLYQLVRTCSMTPTRSIIPICLKCFTEETSSRNTTETDEPISNTWLAHPSSQVWGKHSRGGT